MESPTNKSPTSSLRHVELSKCIVTPEGSIIRMGGPPPKEETDPSWEERKAKRARATESGTQVYGSPSSFSSNWSLRHCSPVPHSTVFDHDVPSPCGSVHDLEIDAEDF